MSQQVETQQQAVGLLIQAAQIAQKRGAFDLNEAGILAEAINLLAPEPLPQEEATEEEIAEEETE